ncbi:MAG: prolyl oligopeptidase family serine peptidase [Anaerolineales bacterium]|nr:prolyl oligopeptidase family serine peptidase [Anaerolineales bacterium]
MSAIQYLQLDSQALQGNAFQDPTQREVAVYLPPDYDSNTAHHYPTVYFLSSHGRTHYYYVGWNQYDEPLGGRLDRLIGSGAMPSVIVVMPDCWTRVGGSQFMDSPIGNYETYLLKEIMPLVDVTFRTDISRRGVLGHSSGGYGALTLAMRHPDVFHALAARAPDSYWEYTVMPALAHLQGQMKKWGGYEAFLRDIPTIHPKRGDFWEAIHTLMQCMAYGPNSEAPLGFDSPIDLETGALVPSVWERWLQFDPVRMIEQPTHQAALRQMRAIVLEVGSYDEYHLQVGARLIHQRLETLGIDHHFEEFPDGHSNTSYRLDVAFPLLGKAL